MKVQRTTEGLRNVLFDTLDDFLSGKVDANHVRTVTKATGAILHVVSIDLNAANIVNSINKGKESPIKLENLSLNINLSSDKNVQHEVIQDVQENPLNESIITKIHSLIPDDSIPEKKTSNGSIIKKTEQGYIHKSRTR